jgi:hypothetical protein
MVEDLISQMADKRPTEIQKALLSLVSQQGEAALETLRGALQEPALTEAALVAMGEIPTQESWELLDDFTGKEAPKHLRKAARRAQHRLRSRGFRPATTERKQTTREFELAQVSYFDHVGDQYLRLVQQAPLGMLNYTAFIVSHTGLKDCFYLSSGRQDIKEIIALENERFGIGLIEVSAVYVGQRVARAVEQSRKHRQSLPEGYIEAAPMLREIPDEEDPPPQLEELPDLGIPTSHAEVQSLLNHESMHSWTFSPDKLQPFVRDWLRILENQPLQTEEGLANLGALQARGQLTNRIIDTFGEPTLQERLVEQLREQARLLLALKENRLAAIALRSAAGLEGNDPAQDPFLRGLVATSMQIAVDLAMEMAEQSRDGWTRSGKEGGELWVPQAPKEREDDEEEPASQLWLPG